MRESIGAFMVVGFVDPFSKTHVGEMNLPAAIGEGTKLVEGVREHPHERQF